MMRLRFSNGSSFALSLQIENCYWEVPRSIKIKLEIPSIRKEEVNLHIGDASMKLVISTKHMKLRPLLHDTRLQIPVSWIPRTLVTVQWKHETCMNQSRFPHKANLVRTAQEVLVFLEWHPKLHLLKITLKDQTFLYFLRSRFGK